MEEEAIQNAIDGICDTVVGDIWFEIADFVEPDREHADEIHKAFVSLVRKAIRRGFDLGRKTVCTTE